MKTKKDFFPLKESLVILLIFVVIAGLLLVQKNGRPYNVDQGKTTYLKGNVPSSNKVFKSLKKETLLLVDGKNESSREIQVEFEQILKDMKMGYQLIDVSTDKIPSFSTYQKVVVLLPHLEKVSSRVDDLMDWTHKGGQVLFGMTMSQDKYLAPIEQKLGIVTSGYTNTQVNSIFIDNEFMIGGNRDYVIDEAFDSARAITLSKDSKIHAWTGDEKKTPLIWEREYGKGKFVIDNFGLYNKAVRGLYAASYSLLTDVTAYPVINGSTYYLDDFPAPVPSGNADYITRDYNMTVSDFYTNIWWPDMLKLAEKYQIKYTGVVIENYENAVNGSTVPQTDLERFRYFGDSLLANGGEIGYHGYNHQPYNLKNTGESDHGYLSWDSTKAMKSSLKELIRFTDELFPGTPKSVYVPPSNILSREGRSMIVKQFPRIKSIASNYFPGEQAYVQEFEIADDGMIEQPRTTSGTILQGYETMAAFSEMNMHFVNNHFIHPDDALDKDRGAAHSWAYMFKHLERHVSWLEKTAPSMRHLTGSQLAGAVQRYAVLKVNQQKTAGELALDLDNFYDKAYLMVRINKGKPGKVSGGRLKQLTGNLYLLEATSSKISIKLIGDNK
ncbi:DUF2194 domain-containing protein [Streptococcus ferus]|uniref:DUF2194 domain-containing protein n=1 Tax=Streptococcus ferus TaxID=1345 RepID=UPI0023541F6F|nr:DUF2194 domain-containing protein [Streptococcus ferus]